MSRINQRVLRTVRLLPQAVKIGIPDEPEQPAGERDDGPDNKEGGVQRHARPSARSSGGASNRQLPPRPNPNKPLLDKIEALKKSLSEAEGRCVDLAGERDKLASEIDGVKADYEGRKKALEAASASNAAKAADEARTKAKEEGWNTGHSEGLSAARAEIEKEYHDKFSGLVASLEMFSQRLEGDFSDLVALNQPRMIRLWSEMLKRMVKRQVELYPDTINNVLSDLLSRLSDKNQILIYVSPEDHERLKDGMDTQFQEVLRGVRHLELKPDPNVEQGSCIVETGLGIYDARWKTQMGQVESVVNNIFQQITKEEAKEEKTEENAKEEPKEEVKEEETEEREDE